MFLNWLYLKTLKVALQMGVRVHKHLLDTRHMNQIQARIKVKGTIYNMIMVIVNSQYGDLAARVVEVSDEGESGNNGGENPQSGGDRKPHYH